MKTKLKLFLWALGMGFFIIACDEDHNDLTTAIIDDAISEEPIDDAMEMGTVSFTTSLKEVIRVTTGRLGLEEVLDILLVTIYASDSSAVNGGRYRDLPEFIELPQGNYHYFMGVMGPVGEIYGADGTFDINFGVNTEVSTTIALKSMALTITFSPEVQTKYPDIRVETRMDFGEDEPQDFGDYDITWNGVLLNFRMDESNFRGIRKWQRRSGDLTLTVVAINPFSQEQFRISRTYTEVGSNQHYNILVAESISETDGSVNFDFTLEDEEVINDTITLPN